MLSRFVCVVLLLLLCWTGGWAGDGLTLDVQARPTGGVSAKGSIVFPVEPAIIRTLLVDYAHWPDLFGVPMRIVELREQDGTAFMDVRIGHSLLPGERRLLCESRLLPEGGLLTELRGGDFKQYHRQWRWLPVRGGSKTKADFELLIEIETMVPDWMIVIAMRQELETHFQIINKKAIELAREGK